MKRFLFSLTLPIIHLASFGQTSLFDSLEVKQCILVIVDDESSSQGTLYFYSKAESTHPDTLSYWWPDMINIPVTVGKNGSAWGKGVHPNTWNKGKLKKEGDGKSPRGVFNTGLAFGYDNTMHVQRLYMRSDANTFCVDDPNSSFYNTIISKDYVTKSDWKSSEKMLRNDDLYRWGLEINYNKNPARKGDGSCIFLHIGRSKTSPTLGCTAMSEKDMVQILGQLKWQTSCFYVLMTREEFKKYKHALGLDITLP